MPFLFKKGTTPRRYIISSTGIRFATGDSRRDIIYAQRFFAGMPAAISSRAADGRSFNSFRKMPS